MVAPQIIHTSKAQITILDDGICYFLYQKNVHLELEDYLETHAVLKDLSYDQSYKILVEFQKHTTISVEARKYAEETEIETTAQALVLHTLAHRIIGRFYYLIHRQKFPLKIFNNKDDALKWLRNV